MMNALAHRWVGAFLSYQFLVLCCVLLFGYSVAGATPSTEGPKRIFIQNRSAQIAVFTAEIVFDNQKMQQGLAGRPPMSDDHGMLFIFNNNSEQYFWMKGMKFSIDILFFDKNKKLLRVLPKLMPCKKCTIYKAPAQSAYALEINAGMADKYGIRTGDRFVISDN